MKKCFVVSRIGEDGSDVRKQADQVLKHIIKPVCQNCGFDVTRVDQVNQSDSITETIIDYLKNSELVIADITGHNPNVFYEMGYRASLNKPIIYMKSKEESIPFDIQNIRTFEYDLKNLDSVDEIKERLERTIKAFNIEEETIEKFNAEDKHDISQNMFSGILPILYQIQDQISTLQHDIKNKDIDMIKSIVQAQTVVEDPNTTLMKTFILEAMRNPNTINNLLSLEDKINNKNKN